LEDRRLLSHVALRHSLAAVASSNGAFSHKDTEFSYTTPKGGHAVINVVGLGNLAGTTVDSSGFLHLVYGGTNAYSKIVGHVTGGDGRAPLASILNSQLVEAGQTNSLSGVGGNVLASVKLGNFDLIAGGTINLTPGVGSLVIDSVGYNTQINLRTLPPAPTPTPTTTTSSGITGVTTSTGTSLTVLTQVTPASSGASASTLEAGQSTTITTNNVSASYVSNGALAQTLSSVSGVFTAGTNLVEPLPTGQPPQTRPPAPPGIIFKVNSINGSPAAPINLLTDAKIFGYDPMTGQLIRFDLNLSNDTGTQDPTFTPIPVHGNPQVAGLSLARNGSQLDVLVSSGTNVYAYNATTGAPVTPVGSFSTTTISSSPIDSIGSTDTLTVLGTFASNQLQAINLAMSLQNGQAYLQGSPYTPTAGFTLLGGLAGFSGSNNLYATVGATFDTFQPNMTQLGIQAIGTGQVHTTPGQGTNFSYKLSTGNSAAIIQSGAYTNVPTSWPPGPALGSIDQSLALVASAANGTNTVDLFGSSASSTRTLTIYYPDLLTSLSASFRPDLTGSALIDIQGNVQSIRGGSAKGMVLNDNGNLNLVKFASVRNSTIVGQPVGHLQIQNRASLTVLTPSRTAAGRNGVTVDHKLQPIGPLSLTND